MAPNQLLTIDGAYGEGGGQVIRTALSLSAVTRRAVEIVNVRANRSKPGLQPQHLTAVRAAASLCAARLEGDAVGSSRLLFSPQAPVQAGAYRFDIRTAGAATLVAQTVLLPLSTAGGASRVEIVGGTHVPHSPPADYLEAVYLPVLRQMGLPVTYDDPRAGFFPKGGGELLLGIPGGTALRPIEMTERGELRSLTAYIITSNLPEAVAERGAATVERYMRGVRRPVTVERHEKPSIGPGAAVVLVARCEGGLAGFTSIGERGKPMEKVATDPCEAFMTWWKSGAAVDERLADQLVLRRPSRAGKAVGRRRAFPCTCTRSCGSRATSCRSRSR